MYDRLAFRIHKLNVIFLLMILTFSSPRAQADYLTGTFEDQYPGANTYKADFSGTNGFNTGGFFLNNNYNATYNAWSGFAVSSKIDNTFGGNDYDHLYGAYTPSGTGAGGSATYGVATNFSQGDAYINLPSNSNPFSIDITNTTYTAQSITQGDAFARAFRQGDYFKLDILGFSDLNGKGTLLGDITVYLADYRGSSLLLIHDWTTIDLTSLAGARSLAFNMTSTDNGPFGMNTPATFAIDNIVAVRSIPEPASLILLLGGLSAVAVRHHRRRRETPAA